MSARRPPGRRTATPSRKAAAPGALPAILRWWWLVVGCAVAAAMLVWGAGFLAEIPLPEAAPRAQSSRIYDVKGQVIGSFHGTENRTIVGLDAISTPMKQAVVAAEDRGFYSHPGVSVRGILRAAFSNIRQGDIGQGASTITQQYARTFAQVGTERTLTRKLKEATLAVKLERRYSKDKILEFYLNTVYFGRGAYGAEAAAQTYFGKPAGELDLAESAYLAGIIRSPGRYQIETNPRGVSEIRTRVLESMLRAGFIDQASKQQAQQVDLASRFRFGLNAELDSPRAGYFVEYVRKLLLTEFKISEKALLSGGLRIYTTLDLGMQVAAEDAVSSTMDRPEDPEVAVLAMDPQGQVRAMVGGRVVNDVQRARGFNFAANLPGNDGGRQAGSAFKPFALAEFVNEGKSVRSVFPAPAQIQLDSARCKNADGTPWKVSNFDDAAYGNLDVIQATTKSVNTVYAQMMDKVVAPANFMAMAAKAGISIPKVDEGCALTLGTSAVTPLEMARGFATFAARGRRPDPLIVLKVTGPDGSTIAERQPRTEQTIDQNVADTVSWILEQNVQSGTGTSARLPWPAMGKTGTTQNFADAWFAGSTPELTSVVWMGFPPDQTTQQIPLMTRVRGRQVTGSSFPAAIWKKFMAKALAGSRHTGFPVPKITGEILNPPPPPCPAGSTPAPGVAGNGFTRGVDGQGAPGDAGNGQLACPSAGPVPLPSPGAFPCVFPFLSQPQCADAQQGQNGQAPEAVPSPPPCYSVDCANQPEPPRRRPPPEPQPSLPAPGKSPCFPFCDNTPP